MPSIEIRGNTELRKSLKDFAPDLERALRLEMGAALRPVVKKAQSFVPNEPPKGLSHWTKRSFSEARFPFYNAALMKKGIRYTTAVSKPNKDGFTSMSRIINQSRVGAIYETAGRKNATGQPWDPRNSSHEFSHSRNPKAGEHFIASLPELVSSHKGRGRLIYRAWRDSRGVAEGAVMRAIDKATTQFYARNQISAFRRAA